MYDQYGNKLVRKAIPYQLYDMAGLQQWFEEMSAKGFLLDSFGIRTGIFRVGEPAPGVRYRLEPQTYWDQSLDYDKNEAYAKMGWEYVDFIGHYYYIYRAEDPETEDLHTDPMTQSYVFDRYLKRHLRAFFAFLVLALGQLAYTIGFDRDSLTLMLPNFLEQLCWIPSMWSPSCWPTCGPCWSSPPWSISGSGSSGSCGQAGHGGPPGRGTAAPPLPGPHGGLLRRPHHPVVRRDSGRFIPPYQQTALTPDRPTPAPLVSLYDLELDPAIQDPEFVYNLAETSFSPLAVKQDLSQWTDWEEPDDPSASISIDYVDAVSPTFAGWVLDSWKRTDEVEDGIPWQEASRPGLDRLYTYIEVPEGPAEYDVGDHHYTVNQFADTYYWLGQAGNQVFRLTVRGTVPPEEALDLLLERIGAAS